MPDELRRDLDRLVQHYQAQRRALPWRRSSDPYLVLVSEVMLQQTQVDRVIPYFERFVTRFPTVDALAKATVDEVLTCWSGLGYYSRGRRLHQAARAIVDRGVFPDTEAELRKLPGVGEYTAAALASIAFGRPAVALDTNALRVLARYLGEREDPYRAAVRKRLRDLARRSLPDRPAGDLTQAIMELGALVCRPGKPLCGACPLAAGCRARIEGLTEAIPPPRAGRPRQDVIWAVARVRSSAGLLVTREKGELLTGLWTCPGLFVDGRADAEAALRDRLRQIGPCRVGPLRGEIRHAITFRRIFCPVYDADFPEELVAEGSPDRLWLDPTNLETVPLPALTRKILELSSGEDRSGPASSCEPTGRRT